MAKKEFQIVPLLSTVLTAGIFRFSTIGWLGLFGLGSFIIFGIFHIYVHRKFTEIYSSFNSMDIMLIITSHILFICLFAFQFDFDDVTEFIMLENFMGDIQWLTLEKSWLLLKISLTVYFALSGLLFLRIKQIKNANPQKFPKNVAIPAKRNSGIIKKALMGLILFFILMALVETTLRMTGNKPGILYSSFTPIDTLIYKPRFKSDSLGLNSFVKHGNGLPDSYQINNQGFRSNINYSRHVIDSLKKLGKKIILVVGDSYVEGCCADPINNSFSDILGKNNQYAVLNFGIGSTDLMQYKLVVKEYAAYLKPDLIIVAFYLGNDIAYIKRIPAPFVPIAYPIQGSTWLSSDVPHYLATKESSVLTSPKQSYQFLIDHFTLLGSERNIIENIFAHSVLLTNLYLGTCEKIKQFKWGFDINVIEHRVHVTNELLFDIRDICQTNEIGLLITTIPAPMDIVKGVDLKARYGRYFEGLDWHYPEVKQFTKDDYDGTRTYNHFNNSGHQKYANFLNTILEKHFLD